MENTDLNVLRKDIEHKIYEFESETAKIQTDFEKTIAGLVKKGYAIDKTKIQSFMSSFWHVYPTKNVGEWEVAIPVCIPFNIGWFDRTEGGYNIFIINKYTQWLGEDIPTFITHEIKIPQGMKIGVNGLDVEFDENQTEKIEDLYGKHFSLIDKGKARVKQGHEFDLLAEIINAGSLPFKPNPVSEDDLMESDFTQIWNEITNKYEPLEIFDGKYSYQGEAWNTFQKYGALGLFWAMSFGKTVEGTYAFSRIKGPKLLVVPSISLKEQWTEFFTKNCQRLLNEVSIVTYQGLSRKEWKNICSKGYVLIIFDECHFLPADSFSKLATLKTKYRIGLSATPYREDGRTNYIMALTGFPVGLDWRKYMNILGKEYHTINVHIVKDLDAKYVLAEQLFNPERRTIIFVNQIKIGDEISERLNLPFIHGTTKERLKIIKESKSFVASRVLELGVSIKDLEHIIEIDFLFGSRREEVQRTGRLMHSIMSGKVHDIVMTKDEYESYGKRLYGLYEKGFRYKIVPHLSGIVVEERGTKTPRTKPSKRGGVNYARIIEDLFNEGYFQTERSFSDVCTSAKRRGVSVTNGLKSSIFSKLNGMVKTGKLFKIESSNGYKFKER